MKIINEDDGAMAEGWIFTYADVITLLMIIFVMLLSFSSLDVPALEKTAEAVANEFGGGPFGKKAEMAPANMLRLDLEDRIFDLQAGQVIKVANDEKGVVMELASAAFYDQGSAELRREAYPVLRRIAAILMAPSYRAYVVEIEGHTDDDHISTLRYPTNWELSTGRAASLARFFIDGKMEPSRLSATGFAETRPKLPNRDADGAPIPENQAKNHRMLIRIYAMSRQQRQKITAKGVK